MEWDVANALDRKIIFDWVTWIINQPIWPNIVLHIKLQSLSDEIKRKEMLMNVLFRAKWV